jgi:hypothetical protein
VERGLTSTSTAILMGDVTSQPEPASRAVEVGGGSRSADGRKPLERSDVEASKLLRETEGASVKLSATSSRSATCSAMAAARSGDVAARAQTTAYRAA